ncbi:MAG: hypothetical protein LQ341_006475 [Variospora aurantia]|nr:MAG: hypothetical protein LQ341_006475 [Variospora aurantia]
MNPSVSNPSRGTRAIPVEKENIYYGPPFDLVPFRDVHDVRADENGTSKATRPAAEPSIESSAAAARSSANVSADVSAERSAKPIYVHPARRLLPEPRDQTEAPNEASAALQRASAEHLRKASCIPQPHSVSNIYSMSDRGEKAASSTISEELRKVRQRLETADPSDHQRIARLRADHQRLLENYIARMPRSEHELIAHCEGATSIRFLRKLQTIRELETILEFFNKVRTRVSLAAQLRVDTEQIKVRKVREEVNARRQSQDLRWGSNHINPSVQGPQAPVEWEQRELPPKEDSLGGRADSFLDRLGLELESRSPTEAMAGVIFEIARLTRTITAMGSRFGSGKKSGGLEGLGVAMVANAQELLAAVQTFTGTAAENMRTTPMGAEMQHPLEDTKLGMERLQGRLELPEAAMEDSLSVAESPQLEVEEVGFPGYHARDSSNEEFFEMQLP